MVLVGPVLLLYSGDSWSLVGHQHKDVRRRALAFHITVLAPGTTSPSRLSSPRIGESMLSLGWFTVPARLLGTVVTDVTH